MEFYNNFQELIDSKAISEKGIEELKTHLEFDGFDLENDGVEIRSYKNTWEVIQDYSPDLFNALEKHTALHLFSEERYFEELQANDGFFSYEIDGLIFIV